MEFKRVLVITDRNFNTSLGRTANLFFKALKNYYAVDCAVVVSKRFFPNDLDITNIPSEYTIIRRPNLFKNVFGNPIKEIESQFSIDNYSFVILCHQFMGYLTPAFKKRFKNSKIITMVHDIFPFILYRPSLKSFFFKKFFFDGIFKSDGFIFNSENSKDMFNTVFQNNNITSKTFAAGLGINSEEFYSVNMSEKEFLREKWKIEQSKKVILNIGLGEWRKNNSLFVSLAENLPDYLFLRLGNFEEKLHNRVQKLDNIRQLSNLSVNQIRELYNIADVYIMPSYFEGFSLTGLEAMCCSTPVVASYMSAHKEIYKDLVEFVYDPDNVKGFIDKIQMLIEKDGNINTEKLKERLDYYSNKKFGERVVNFLDSIF